MQKSIGDKEVLEEIERLKQAQHAKTNDFNMASNDVDDDEVPDVPENQFINERGSPRLKETRLPKEDD